MALQIESVYEPFVGSELAPAATTLLARADVLGLVPDGGPTSRLDIELMRRTLSQLRAHGIPARAPSGRNAPDWLHALRQANDALEGSPIPLVEWPALRSVLGDELVARLCGVSAMSVRRYASGERRTPDAVAHRLHQLMLIVADLRGGYNDFGVRRWFDRRRAQLQERSPAEMLAGDWDPDDPGAHAVRDLAASLTSSPVT